MHSSAFSYAITRPYPYRFFTPVVIVGFVVFLALFSFINYVSTGYQLVVVQSANPNSTVHENPWMRHWPSFLTSNVQPTCQTANLAIGSKWFTNQTALTYTLTDVWQPDGGNAGAGYGVSPSLTYFSNVLEDCKVNSVEIDYNALDRTASQFAFSEWGAVVRTYATCSILGVNGTTSFNLTNEYDYVPSDISFSHLYTFLGTNFLSRNRTSKSSLWMQTIRENQTSYNETGIRSGTLYFYPNDDVTITNMTDPTFFECDFRFIVDKGQGAYDFITPRTYGDYRNYTSLSNLIASQAYPNIWSDADTLAKAAFSTVLTDLGQVNTPSNILTDPGLLSYFTSNFSEARHNIANAYPGPADRSYGTEDSGPLGTTPSLISTKYLCQVPQRKPAGMLFWSIAVADLVFLQALWFLFRFVVDTFFLRRHPERNFCEGCMEQPRTTLYRSASPGPADRYGKEDLEVEMGGLRPSARSRDSRSLSRIRSVSQQRLIGPESMDIGAHHPPGRYCNLILPSKLSTTMRSEQPPTIMSTEQTQEEQKNIDICKQYMSIAYSPQDNKGGSSVQHLCHSDSWFWSPSTFPGAQSPMDYAESHSHVMASVNDLHIVRYDQAWAKNGHVLLRYTAEGSFKGEPYQGIEPNGNHARWSAAAIFEVEEEKIRSFTKDWDQKVMQIQLGWAPVKESDNPRWNLEALKNPEEARKEN
ncbi:hypothetical protein LTR49_008431 [Elasticomyces elasticus]|nr:hypothetical protein LTR49_008431 [Elasticomyces elasticus]KAK5761740.1 hypothetical protein LTS12_008173 [Elasticomyces elasticus]